MRVSRTTINFLAMTHGNWTANGAGTMLEWSQWECRRRARSAILRAIRKYHAGKSGTKVFYRKRYGTILPASVAMILRELGLTADRMAGPSRSFGGS